MSGIESADCSQHLGVCPTPLTLAIKRAERAEARVARVEALAAEWEALGFVSIYESATEIAEALRAAIKGDA